MLAALEERSVSAAAAAASAALRSQRVGGAPGRALVKLWNSSTGAMEPPNRAILREGGWETEGEQKRSGKSTG